MLRLSWTWYTARTHLFYSSVKHTPLKRCLRRFFLGTLPYLLYLNQNLIIFILLFFETFVNKCVELWINNLKFYYPDKCELTRKSVISIYKNFNSFRLIKFLLIILDGWKMEKNHSITSYLVEQENQVSNRKDFLSILKDMHKYRIAIELSLTQLKCIPRCIYVLSLGCISAKQLYFI